MVLPPVSMALLAITRYSDPNTFMAILGHFVTLIDSVLIAGNIDRKFNPFYFCKIKLTKWLQGVAIK